MVGEIAWALIDTPLGRLTAAATGRGVVTLSFEDPAVVGGRLTSRLSPRIRERPDRLAQLRRELDEYFTGRRRRFDVPVDLRLVGGFGQAVLQAAAAIPYGQVITYAEVAAAAGRPAAARAAGNALARNPIPIVVPCHRVVRSGGAVGGYAGGQEAKERLLRLEACGSAPGG